MSRQGSACWRMGVASTQNVSTPLPSLAKSKHCLRASCRTFSTPKSSVPSLKLASRGPQGVVGRAIAVGSTGRSSQAQLVVLSQRDAVGLPFPPFRLTRLRHPAVCLHRAYTTPSLCPASCLDESARLLRMLLDDGPAPRVPLHSLSCFCWRHRAIALDAAFLRRFG